MYKLLVYIIVTVGIYGVLLYLAGKSKLELVKSVKENNIVKNVQANVGIIYKRGMLKKQQKYITTFSIIILSVILCLISFGIFFKLFKVVSTAIILSIPFLLFPTLLLKFLVRKEKSQILAILPMYVINIKNHITEENNIINAIKQTSVEEPLNKYIVAFKINISKGVNVIKAMDMLDEAVNIKEFSDFIVACKACYTNGGNFAAVLERYIEMLTKENINRETTKEKAYSGVLTLVMMVILNVFVIFMFVFRNAEYANIIQNTFVGHVILDINAISYILIAYLTSKIYKEE